MESIYHRFDTPCGFSSPVSRAAGFTLIELLVVVAIITIVTAVIFTGQTNFSSSVTLTNTTYDIALTGRNAEVYGLGTRASGGSSNTGYGLDFSSGTPNSYLFFADLYPTASTCHTAQNGLNAPNAYPGDCTYSTNDATISSYQLGNGMNISKFCGYSSSWTCSDTTANQLDIVYVRPNATPFMSINGSYNAVNPVTQACLAITSPQGASRYIFFSSSGQITANASSCPVAAGALGGGSPPQAASCTLTATPSSITSGQFSSLSWTTSNATSFSIDHNIGTLMPTSIGSTNVYPTANTTYVGTASGAGGSGTCLASVLVGSSPYPIFAGSSSSGLAQPQSLAIAGSYVYVSDFANKSIVTFDVSNPAHPQKVSSVSTGIAAGPMYLATAGGYLYATNYYDNNLTTFDIATSPSTPVLKNTTTVGLSGPFGLAVANGYLYVANYTDTSGLVTFSLANPAAPSEIGNISGAISGTAGARGITVANGYAYMTGFNNNVLTTFDLASPAHPVYKSTVSTTAGGQADPSGISVIGGYAYVVNYLTDLAVFSLASPATPSRVTNVSTGLSHPAGLAVSGNYAYISSSGNGKIITFDITDPFHPVSADSTSTGVSSPGNMILSGGHLYVSDQGNTSLVIFTVGS